MTPTHPTPTQQETLERFVLDKSDCVDGGDGCKAEMRHSIAGAFVYHSDIEYVRAAVAGPRGDAESLVKKWIATLQDESRVTDEDAEDLTFRIIAFAAPSSPTPAESDVAFAFICNEARDVITCSRCGARFWADLKGTFRINHTCAAPPERTRVAGEQETIK